MEAETCVDASLVDQSVVEAGTTIRSGHGVILAMVESSDEYGTGTFRGGYLLKDRIWGD